MIGLFVQHVYHLQIAESHIMLNTAGKYKNICSTD